ncbi:MAG: glycosyltransferase family 39 protein [Chloroflexota bacterium]|nr:glycosyltransferase family 39 protein [Dehalococcoidia bacterium]MDW8253940.1 glycosyltransferase family 39 protein [Chloroflexota bacterium]
MRVHLRLALVAAAFAALAALTSIAIPPYEAPDETIHLDYVFHLRLRAALPVMTGDPATTVGGQQAFHPPLYYALAALLTLPADPSGYREAQRINWFQQFDRSLPGNKNVVIHEQSGLLPFRGPTLAVHLARLASVLCGVVTVVLGGLAAREAGLADGAALLVAGFIATLPQFVFLSAVTNSDNAVIAAAAAAVYVSLRLLRRGVTTAGVVALGIAGGLATLAKMSGAIVAALALAGLLLAHWGGRARGRSLARDLLLLAVPAAALSGWWFVRNLALYGDPLAWRELVVLADAIVRRDLSPAAIAAELLTLRHSSWALFGWGNVGLPDWAYLVFDAVVLLGLAGWLLRLRRRPALQNDGVTPQPRAALLLLSWCAAFAVALGRWIAAFEHGGQGRLWFPALVPFAILLVSGLAGLLPRRRLALPLLVVASLGALAAAAPWAVIRPAYAAPLPPPGPVPENIRAPFSPGLELVGYRFAPERVVPGEVATLWLWWRVDRPVDSDLAVQLRVLARDFRPVAEVRSYPAAGSTTFDQHAAGTVLADHHYFRVPHTLDAPDYLRVEIALLERRSRAAIVSERGMVTVGPLRVTGGVWPPKGMTQAELAIPGALRLDGVRIEQYPPEQAASGGSLALLLAWTAEARARTAAARIELLDPAGRVVVAADRGLGSWHLVEQWRAGDRFVDELDLDLPPWLEDGDYHVRLMATVDGKSAAGSVGVVRR